MANKQNDPKSLPYWIERGGLKTAEQLHRQSKSGVETINKLVRFYKGIPRKIAGELFSLAHRAISAAYELFRPTGFGTVPTETIPVNPRLFPEGRLGRRFRYRVYVRFRAAKERDDVPLTVFVTSGEPLTMEEILAKATAQAWKDLGTYPRDLLGMGWGPNYVPERIFQSAWRSH